MDKTICLEQYGSTNVRRTYTIGIDGHTHTTNNASNQSVESAPMTLSMKNHSENLTSLSQFFRSIFLPQGYPDSVSRDYLQYQIWDTVQAFSSSITGSLATQAVLQGVGVGDESATVLAATMTWILKDGTGMVGRILFAWLKGTSLDCDCKRWRLFADILNDFAICLEILAPHFKDQFRLIVCVSGVARSIVGVAGGATRAALTQHQARRNNMADVSAKDNSQETLVNLAALLVSLVLIPMVTGNHPLIWTLFFIFTALHLYANYRAVRAVSMESFNQSRLHFLTEIYLASKTAQIGSIEEINRIEPVIFGLPRQLKILHGVSLSWLVASYNDFQKLMQIYRQQNYLLVLDLKRKLILISLHSRATTLDQLQACFLAEILEYAWKLGRSENSAPDPRLGRIVSALQAGDTWTVLSMAQEFASGVFPGFSRHASSVGWSLDHALLSADEWRVEWDLAGLEGKKGF